MYRGANDVIGGIYFRGLEGNHSAARLKKRKIIRYITTASNIALDAKMASSVVTHTRFPITGIREALKETLKKCVDS